MKAVAVGTRGSSLALAQTRWVIARLLSLDPGIRWEPVVITTSGDRSASAVRGDGAFVKEIERALLEGAVDLAVHSLKDLPTDPVEGLVLGAVPRRADPRDAVVGTRLDSLPPGARVGTGSPRRSAQLRHLRPDLLVEPLRGNVPTRVEAARSGRLDAVVVAAAGLERLGLEADEVLAPGRMLPAPGQGALAVQARAGDDDLRERLAGIHDAGAAAAVDAERALLRHLGGGCLLPVGALAEARPGGTLVLSGCATSSDGTRQVRAGGEAPLAEADELGSEVAGKLVDLGALDLLGAGTRG
jgi:hydroxymethylbilane synthase